MKQKQMADWDVAEEYFGENENFSFVYLGDQIREGDVFVFTREDGTKGIARATDTHRRVSGDHWPHFRAGTRVPFSR
jgi:hypothetical protein